MLLVKRLITRLLAIGILFAVKGAKLVQKLWYVLLTLGLTAAIAWTAYTSYAPSATAVLSAGEPKYAAQFNTAWINKDGAGAAAAAGKDAPPDIRDPEKAAFAIAQMDAFGMDVKNYKYVGKHTAADGKTFVYYVLFYISGGEDKEIWEVIVLDAEGKVIELH